MWGCHCVAAWLIQANIVSGWDVYIIFLILIFKTYMYYVFNIYMYYKRNIGGLWLHPNLALLEKIFRPTCGILKEIDPQIDFLHMWFIYCFLIDIVLFYNWFSTSRHSKLVGYACYLVHSLSMWFTHSLTFSYFQVRSWFCSLVRW